MSCRKRTVEGRKKKQASFAGLPLNTGHRSHKSGVERFARAWTARHHEKELKKWLTHDNSVHQHETNEKEVQDE